MGPGQEVCRLHICVITWHDRHSMTLGFGWFSEFVRDLSASETIDCDTDGGKVTRGKKQEGVRSQEEGLPVVDKGHLEQASRRLWAGREFHIGKERKYTNQSPGLSFLLLERTLLRRIQILCG